MGGSYDAFMTVDDGWPNGKMDELRSVFECFVFFLSLFFPVPFAFHSRVDTSMVDLDSCGTCQANNSRQVQKQSAGLSLTRIQVVLALVLLKNLLALLFLHCCS